MGDITLANHQFVAIQEDFGYGVAFVSVVFEVAFCSEVVEADGFGVGFVESPLGVVVDDLVAVLYEFEADVTTGFYGEFIFWLGQEFH